jgi:hypothetical protein
MATATDAPTRVGFTEAEPARPTKLTVNRERRLFAAAAFAMLVLTAVGFRQFILHGRAIGGVPMTPQILALVVMHGLAMLGWVVLFCVQSTLIVANRQRLHLVLGKVGAWLAGAIVILGLAVAPLSVHYNPAAYDDFGGARYFLALMWPEPLTFGVLVAVALAYRHRPEVHRPMMLLATVGLMTGPLTRWPYWDTLVRFGNGSVAAAMFGQMLALGATLLVVHALSITRKLRHVEPQFDIGESGEPPPHDDVARRRITRSGKIAAEPRHFGEV